MARHWQQVSMDEAKQHPLYGVKNWLAVFAFGVLVIPLRELGELSGAAHDAGMTLTQFLAQNAAFGIFVKAVLALETLMLAVVYWLLFTRNRGFRVTASVLLLGYWPAVALFALATQAPGVGGAIGQGLISWVLSCVVWVTYLQRSRRVRITFENCVVLDKASSALTPAQPMPPVAATAPANTSVAPALTTVKLTSSFQPIGTTAAVTLTSPVEVNVATKFGPWVFGAVCLVALLVNVLLKKESAPGQPVTAIASTSAIVYPPLDKAEEQLAFNALETYNDMLRQKAMDDAGLTQAPPLPPVPVFRDTETRLAHLRWLGQMGDKLGNKISSEQIRTEFLQTVWYESTGAGLDASIVLAVIATHSDFRKFYMSQQNARGFMGINPSWSSKIGDGDQRKLFNMPTNLRIGCVLLKHYLAKRNGEMYPALLDYVADSLRAERDDPRTVELAQRVIREAANWQ